MNFSNSDSWLYGSDQFRDGFKAGHEAAHSQVGTVVLDQAEEIERLKARNAKLEKFIVNTALASF